MASMNYLVKDQDSFMRTLPDHKGPGGGLRNYHTSDPVVGRVLLATMPGEIACPLDGEKEKDQIAPVPFPFRL